MNITEKRTVTLTKEEVEAILFKAIFGVEVSAACIADFGYSSYWRTAELSVQEVFVVPVENMQLEPLKACNKL